jgi:septal ring factor EnvC (AmiA/AmiB activator)
MRFNTFSFAIGIVTGAVVVGLLLGLKVINQNKTIQEKEKEISSLQNTIDSKQKEVSSLQQMIGTKYQEVQRLESEISKAEQSVKQNAKQVEYMAQPDLPIKIGLRQAVLSNTKVLQLTNYSRNSIRVNVSSSFEGQTQSRVIDLPPDVIRELGQKEGFPFKTGDSVMIETQGYRKKPVSIP